MPPTHPLRHCERPIREHQLHALLKDLGSQLRRGEATREEASPLPPLATGQPELDRLLGGGFPPGHLSEVSGPASSGRTSLLLCLLAQTTRSGRFAAVVDRADAFDPPSAEAAGVVLDHVLWVRAQQWRPALRCCERLIETDGFPLVVLDWPQHPGSQAEGTRRPERRSPRTRRESIPDAVWLRLTRLAAARQTALLLLSGERIAGSRAAIALELEPAAVRFTGTPPLLEEFETRVHLVRRRVSSSPASSLSVSRPSKVRRETDAA